MLTTLRILLKVPLTFTTDLPHPLRVGDRLSFNTTITKVKGRRTATLALMGSVEVVSPPTYMVGVSPRMEVSVKWVGKEPVWVAVRNSPPKTLPPARSRPHRIQ